MASTPPPTPADAKRRSLFSKGLSEIDQFLYVNRVIELPLWVTAVLAFLVLAILVMSLVVLVRKPVCSCDGAIEKQTKEQAPMPASVPAADAADDSVEDANPISGYLMLAGSYNDQKSANGATGQLAKKLAGCSPKIEPTVRFCVKSAARDKLFALTVTTGDWQNLSQEDAKKLAACFGGDVLVKEAMLYSNTRDCL